MTVIFVAAALVAYNNLINLWPPFSRQAYVPVNLAVTVVLAAVALSLLGLSTDELGLHPPEWDDIAFGVALGVAAALPLFLALGWRRSARVLADQRVAGLGGGRLVYVALVRIPLGTAALEELAFRGVLFAAWRPLGTVSAALASSVAFGLWHITPTLSLVGENRPDASTLVRLVVVASAVALTTAGGLVLVWTRVRTGGVVAPWALHATVNALATVAGVLAHRRAALTS